MGGKQTVGFEAEATIRRSDFGLGFGVPMVGDEVELEIHAAFEKQ
jgi:polyisoprenoid-binding protein YceI